MQEELLEAWVGITALFKNNRLTTGMTYNEATVLMYTYQKYEADGQPIAIQDLLKKTRMQKSLLNRTVDALVKKDLVEKQRGEHDARTVYISLHLEHKEVFEKIHMNSLSLIQQVIDVIGEDDAKTFVEIYRKLNESEKFK